MASSLSHRVFMSTAALQTYYLPRETAVNRGPTSWGSCSSEAKTNKRVNDPECAQRQWTQDAAEVAGGASKGGFIQETSLHEEPNSSMNEM